MNEADMHGAIRGLYEGILDPGAWQDSLRALTGLAGAAHASMMVWDTVRDQVSVNEIVNPVVELFTEYESDYQAIDPAKQFAPRMRPGDWYIDARELGEGTMARHPFYRDFFYRYGLRSYVACLVERQPHYEVYFSMQRARRQPLFSSVDTGGMDWIIPHMRSAMAMRDRTLGLTVLARLSTQLVERLNFALLVYSPQRQVLLCNRAGERWARRLDPAGKVSEWTLSRPFADMVQAACDPRHAVAAQAARATSSDASAQVIVLPLPPSHAFAAQWQEPAALVIVHEHDRAPLLLGPVLRDLYGLTPAETRLSVQLAHGQGLPEASQQLGIRHETARSQLKAVFNKTGCSSQAQLTHLLSRLGAALEQA
ncbi:helix-turn-helix transcriptional regulator [Cupriavidus taiwanensis]|uniref:Putative transcriptional Regulator, LuxR family n=1 Tax=Cupriavidus taiwanensis TaxID=164546 RepID=A0A375IJH8_9BURK|nr:helix-turn-helix transcriptional regulator [Cupriavidus taiwanensis]SOY54658.1 putative transcriptional Regulator, LuxR family [Cupriavidus taiwanensis]SOY55330.1 putative transcriptional Regulator, LuxR family [Cupriavidus taiwanensis]SOY89470.1 putative transcriptional Regulator, LuxR family [Cupriavidus taiwanensis]SOZ24976.1 putative transcriptional Regulator, LuxR family [Cupriavidus taiwanensis]SOZ61657.1 putative transcriptional Regulator, LuxR family [Cupriavidus taiwanensis]